MDLTPQQIYNIIIGLVVLITFIMAATALGRSTTVSVKTGSGN